MGVKYLPVFAYGTLQADGVSAWILKGKLMRVARASARGTVLSITAAYPTVVFSKGEEIIEGGLLWIEPDLHEETIRVLDHYEGHPNLFKRIKIIVSCSEGEVEAYVYEWKQRDVG